jgi:hypothetical protein
MRVFTRMRELLQNNQNIMNKLMEMEGKGAKRDESISLIFDYLRQLEHEKQQVENQRNRKKIGLKKKSKITTFLQYPTTHNQTVKQILQQKNPDPL